VILRHATNDDANTFESFDLGDPAEPWLGEVIEIVDGLLAWRAAPDGAGEDRQVDVIDDGELLAVAAHVRLVGSDGSPMPEHRYLMVTAVRADQRRNGLARHLVESVLADLARQNVKTVEWLVHPRNLPSITFSRTTFPEAQETYPPDDKPYVSFALDL